MMIGRIPFIPYAVSSYTNHDFFYTDQQLVEREHNTVI